METHEAWDLRWAYSELWHRYSDEIENVEMSQLMLIGYDLVISTVPRKLWAEPGDVFEAQRIWALGDTDRVRVNMFRPPDFTVICNGEPYPEWYRVSNIFDHCTMEWPAFWGLEPPCPGASLVEKPLWHNSTAASDFIHLGRYGAWQKGVLTTDAFTEAMKVFARDAIES
jgi:hypothetical protein